MEAAEPRIFDGIYVSKAAPTKILTAVTFRTKIASLACRLFDIMYNINTYNDSNYLHNNKILT